MQGTGGHSRNLIGRGERDGDRSRSRSSANVTLFLRSQDSVFPRTLIIGRCFERPPLLSMRTSFTGPALRGSPWLCLQSVPGAVEQVVPGAVVTDGEEGFLDPFTCCFSFFLPRRTRDPFRGRRSNSNELGVTGIVGLCITGSLGLFLELGCCHNPSWRSCGGMALLTRGATSFFLAVVRDCVPAVAFHFFFSDHALRGEFCMRARVRTPQILGSGISGGNSLGDAESGFFLTSKGSLSRVAERAAARLSRAALRSSHCRFNSGCNSQHLASVCPRFPQCLHSRSW